MIRYLLLICLATASLPLATVGATYYSRSNGNWGDTSVWSLTPGGASCNCVPQGSDDIVISHMVNLQKHLTNGGGCLGGVSSNLFITASGFLNGSSNYDLNVLSNGNLTVCGSLSCKNIEFFNGSVFSFCLGSHVNINGNFINRNNSPNILVDGQVQIQGSFENGVGAFIGGSGSFIVVTGPAVNQGTVFTCIGLYPCSLYACIISSVCGAQVFLPVEWLSFQAVQQDGGTLLQWSTASETNADRFDIERSPDGIDFESIGSREAHGTTSQQQQYSFLDPGPIYGKVYYRIRETDFDGRSSYSVTEVVNVRSRTGISIVPNPIRGHRMNVRFDEGAGVACSIELLDDLGRSVFKADVRDASSGQGIELPACVVPGSYRLLVRTPDGCRFEHVFVEP